MASKKDLDHLTKDIIHEQGSDALENAALIRHKELQRNWNLKPHEAKHVYDAIEKKSPKFVDYHRTQEGHEGYPKHKSVWKETLKDSREYGDKEMEKKLVSTPHKDLTDREKKHWLSSSNSGDPSYNNFHKDKGPKK